MLYRDALDLERLKDQAWKSALAGKIENRFDGLRFLESVSSWETIKEETQEASRLDTGSNLASQFTIMLVASAVCPVAMYAV